MADPRSMKFVPLALVAPLLLAVSVAASASAQDAGAAAAPPKPNVVLLLADDLGMGDLACFGGWIPAPHIAELAAAGANFTHAYAAAPVCTPSRAGLYTGRYPACLGVQANTGTNKVARKRAKGMPGEVLTIPERLSVLGIHTGLIGKWHLGLKEDMQPIGQGFDEFFGFLGPSHLYLPDSHDTKMLRGRELEPETEHEYLTDAFARESVAFLARNKARPFALTVAFNAPHNPFEATETYLSRFPELKGQKRAYAAMVSALDDAVGRILASLEKEGLAQNTLVFFASDNGAPPDESPGSNGELNEGKAFLFEGGVRVPMILRWPGRVTPGTTIATPVSLLDISATTLALAGADAATLAQLDGVDLQPLLAGKPAPERTFFWKLGPSAAIRKGDWKLVISKESRWFFDLAADPDEHADLHGSKTELETALADELDAWIAKLPEQLWKNEELEQPLTVLGKSYWIEY